MLGVAVAPGVEEGDGVEPGELAAEPGPDGPQAASRKTTQPVTRTLADRCLMPLERPLRQGVTAVASPL